MKDQSISVIIPSYNENARILKVLKVLANCPRVTEVIVVDDGSDSESRAIIKQAEKDYPNFSFLEHTKNLGKTAAIYSGFQKASSQTILLLDADLVGLNSYHISGFIDAYFSNPVDMLISDRQECFALNRNYGIEIALSGDRIIAKGLLMKHLEVFAAKGYLFEAALNRIMFHNYRVAKYVLKGVAQTNKVTKYGLIGLLRDVLMLVRISIFLGFTEFLWQPKFAREMKSVN